MNRNKVYVGPLCVLIPIDSHSVGVCCSDNTYSETSIESIIDKEAEESNEVEPDPSDCGLFPKGPFPYRRTIF